MRAALGRQRWEAMTNATPNVARAQDFSQIEVCELPIQGMTCGACVRRVERALSRVPGVQDASVNFVTQRATVRFDSASTNRELLTRAVEDAGYEIPRPKSLEVAAGTKQRTSAEERGNALQAAEE